jgi:hypothetical protein
LAPADWVPDKYLQAARRGPMYQHASRVGVSLLFRPVCNSAALPRCLGGRKVKALARLRCSRGGSVVAGLLSLAVPGRGVVGRAKLRQSKHARNNVPPATTQRPVCAPPSIKSMSAPAPQPAASGPDGAHGLPGNCFLAVPRHSIIALPPFWPPP